MHHLFTRVNLVVCALLSAAAGGTVPPAAAGTVPTVAELIDRAAATTERYPTLRAGFADERLWPASTRWETGRVRVLWPDWLEYTVHEKGWGAGRPAELRPSKEPVSRLVAQGRWWDDGRQRVRVFEGGAESEYVTGSLGPRVPRPSLPGLLACYASPRKVLDFVPREESTVRAIERQGRRYWRVEFYRTSDATRHRLYFGSEGLVEGWEQDPLPLPDPTPPARVGRERPGKLRVEPERGRRVWLYALRLGEPMTPESFRPPGRGTPAEAHGLGRVPKVLPHRAGVGGALHAEGLLNTYVDTQALPVDRRNTWSENGRSRSRSG